MHLCVQQVHIIMPLDFWIPVRVVGMTWPIRPFIWSSSFQRSLTGTYSSLRIPTYHPTHIRMYAPLHNDSILISVQQPSRTLHTSLHVPTTPPLHSVSQDPTLHTP